MWISIEIAITITIAIELKLEYIPRQALDCSTIALEALHDRHWNCRTYKSIRISHTVWSTFRQSSHQRLSWQHSFPGVVENSSKPWSGIYPLSRTQKQALLLVIVRSLRINPCFFHKCLRRLIHIEGFMFQKNSLCLFIKMPTKKQRWRTPSLSWCTS